MSTNITALNITAPPSAPPGGVLPDIGGGLDGGASLTDAFISSLVASSTTPVAALFLDKRTHASFLDSMPAELSEPIMTTGITQALAGVLLGAVIVHLLADVVVLGSLFPAQRTPAVEYHTSVANAGMRGNLQPFVWLALLALLVLQFMGCADHAGSILSLLYYFGTLACLPKVALSRRRLARAARTTVRLKDEVEKEVLMHIGYGNFLQIPLLFGLIGCQQWVAYSSCAAGGYYVTTKYLLEFVADPASAQERLDNYELYESLILSLLIVIPLLGAITIVTLWWRAVRKNQGLPWMANPLPRRERGASTTSVKLPRGWKAVASAQGTYYYNSKTKETTWDKPGVAIGTPPPAPAAPPPLSLGAPPALEPPAESSYTGGGRGSMVPVTMAPPSIMTPSPPAPPMPDGAPLPSGWEEATSADGESFFWNAESGASSWERPTK